MKPLPGSFLIVGPVLVYKKINALEHSWGFINICSVMERVENKANDGPITTFSDRTCTTV